MAKTTKKQEIENLQKINSLQSQLLDAFDNGDTKLIAELKKQIAELKNGTSSSTSSNVDLEKVNVSFKDLNNIYSQVSSDVYRSNSKTLKKAKEGETATKLGIYSRYADAFYGAFVKLVVLNGLFNGVGISLYQYNLLKCKVFDNVKNEEELHAELVKLVGDGCKREDIKNYLDLSLMSKGFDGAMKMLEPFVNMPKEEPTKEEPTKEEPTKEEPTKEEPTKEEPTKEEPTKEEPTKEEPTTDKKGKKGKK